VRLISYSRLVHPSVALHAASVCDQRCSSGIRRRIALVALHLCLVAQGQAAAWSIVPDAMAVVGRLAYSDGAVTLCAHLPNRQARMPLVRTDAVSLRHRLRDTRRADLCRSIPSNAGSGL